MKVRWSALIISLIVVAIVAFLGSLFTSQSVKSEWYQSIKPSITPPNFVFPIVWTILFFLIALALYFSWINAKNIKTKSTIVLVFVINFILNVLWSAFFFGLRSPIIGFIDIIVLWFSILAMILITRQINRTAAWLLVPYLLWVTFAAILNLIIAF